MLILLRTMLGELRLLTLANAAAIFAFQVLLLFPSQRSSHLSHQQLLLPWLRGGCGGGGRQQDPILETYSKFLKISKSLFDFKSQFLLMKQKAKSEREKSETDNTRAGKWF